MNAGKPPSSGSLNAGWITGVSPVCAISASGTIISVNLPNANQNLYYHFPVCAVCAVCNRFVEKFEQVERFETLDIIVFRANCHGRAEEKIITREALIGNPYIVRDLVARPWFMADYEKLKVAQLEVKPPPKPAPSLLDKPVRAIDLE